MAEDGEGSKNKKPSEHKESVKAIGNSWIICRSQSHSGRIYYFNTLTGKSAWNLSDAEIEKAQLLPREAASGAHVGDCPEPTEPPGDAPHSGHHNVCPKDAGARIYNKQIINNQYSKPYTIPAFQNNHCACGPTDTNMNVASLYNPAMWLIPPPHQVLLASAAAVLANAQPNINNPNMPIPSTPLPISNYFPMGNQSLNHSSPHYQGFRNANFNKGTARWNQSSSRNFQGNSPNDLRDILSRRKDQRNYRDESQGSKVNEECGNNLLSEHEKMKFVTKDLDPSDIDDEWLEANINSNIPCVWKKCSDVDCWIVVANAYVMLNNRKFLSKLIKPEEQIYLLTPLEVLKQLRSVTGDTDCDFRRVQRARCALRLAAQQIDKVPAGLKRLQNRTLEHCCVELIQQNYHVLLLHDDSELSRQIDIEGVIKFTINKLKECLNQNLNKWKPGTHKNITVTISQEIGEKNKIDNQPAKESPNIHNTEHKSKEIEIQTEQKMPLVKTTMDACIQTDFDVLQSAQINQSNVSKNVESPVCTLSSHTAGKSPLPTVNKSPLNTLANKSPLNMGINKSTGAGSPLNRGTSEPQLDTVVNKSPLNTAVNKSPLNTAVNKSPLNMAVNKSPLNMAVNKSPLNEFSGAKSPLNTGISKSLFNRAVNKSPNTAIKKSHILEESSEVEESHVGLVINSINDNKDEESKVAPKKIRLNRQVSSISTASSVTTKQFKWRKHRPKTSASITPPTKDGNISDNRPASSKSPPSSLISISDLLPPQNDNFSDLAKSIAFSDASIEKTPEMVNKVIDESSLDVISNSVDENDPVISMKDILNESKDSENEDIVMYEVTSQVMDDYLSRGCDEWVSRFVQIMEEALSQILLQEPCYFDPAMPPPWSVYEATVCIKRKFEKNSKIVFACIECGRFLLKISDSRGKIFAELNPSDFMRLYSYGVYLIESLQSSMNDSEDLQIAKESLDKLLDDIKNPNLDVAQNVFMETFMTEKQDITANVSDLTAGAADDLIEDALMSPPKNTKQTPCVPSPLRYDLRSSEKSIEQTEKGLSVGVGDQNMVIEETFFTSLDPHKTSSSIDIRLPTETSPQETSLPNHSLNCDTKRPEDPLDNEIKGPKIIRNFNIYPDFEKKLKKSNPPKSSNGSNVYDFDYDDYTDDSVYYGHDLADASNDYSAMDPQLQYCTKSDEIGAQILKFVIERTTYPVHRVLEDLHNFCEDTRNELSSQNEMDPLQKANLIEKTSEVRERLNNLCDHLNSILCRKDTKMKVRLMLEELGFISSEINDTQVAEYKDLVQKYLDQATILFESVNLIAAAIREE